MFANDQMLAKEIDNASDSARFVSVSAHRLSTPMAGGKIIPMEQPGELLSTPANVILPPAPENISALFIMVLKMIKSAITGCRGWMNR